MIGDVPPVNISPVDLGTLGPFHHDSRTFSEVEDFTMCRCVWLSH